MISTIYACDRRTELRLPRLPSHRLTRQRVGIASRQLYKLGVLARVDSHNIAVDDGHGAACRRDHKVAVHFEYCPLSYQPLGQVLAWKFARCLQLFVPVTCLTGNMLFIAEPWRERWKICSFVHNLLHCVSKKLPTFKLYVTLSNLNRFSKFLHCWKAYKICYKINMTLPTSPQSCCYTTLGGVV